MKIRGKVLDIDIIVFWLLNGFNRCIRLSRSLYNGFYVALAHKKKDKNIFFLTFFLIKSDILLSTN